MRENEVARCAQCGGELRAIWRLAGGPRLRALAILLLVLGGGLMVLSPPQPVLAVPATVLLVAACALLLRREYRWVCQQCRVTTQSDCPWLECHGDVSV